MESSNLINNNVVSIKTDNNLATNEEVKAKNYRIRNTNWYCACCEVYCNSQSQFDVHLISQKHKFVLSKPEENEESNADIDENNNVKLEDLTETDTVEEKQNYRTRVSFSLAEIQNNPLAIKFQIDAVKYLITEDKKKGKFEKFGFYCKTCDAYMTGQIQLIMHVKGAKHNFYHPNEIPGYTNNSTKKFNPIQKRKHQMEPLFNNEMKLNNYSQLNAARRNQNNRQQKLYNVQNQIGYQHYYGSYNNSVNNTTIYSMPHHVTPVKITNETKETNWDNRLYQNDMFNNSPQMQQMLPNFNMNKRIQEQQQYQPNTWHNSEQNNFNSTNERNVYPVNVNLVSNGMNSLQIKDEKSDNESFSYVKLEHDEQSFKAPHHLVYNTPPPEPNQYGTQSTLYMPSDPMQQQQRPQLMHNNTSPQIIFQSRIGHGIPVMMPINSNQSPISSSSISFYHPQLQNHNQQIHQNF